MAGVIGNMYIQEAIVARHVTASLCLTHSLYNIGAVRKPIARKNVVEHAPASAPA